MQSILNGLKSYWFLIIALVTVTVAFAESTQKIKTLEDAVKQNSSIQQEVNAMKAQSERIDERTQATKESTLRLERMVEMLLQNQRTQLRQNP